jgi:SAM-dependent methyltransferase
LTEAHLHGRASLFQGDVRALPMRDRSYDLVTLFDVLEHVDDEQKALGEVRRVLRPGGLAVLSVPAYDWLYAHNDRVAGRVRRYTRARLRRALEAADLKVERLTHANVVLFPLIAPTVLMFKLLEALRIVPATARHTNLSVPTPPWLATVLYRAFTSELSFSGRFDIPFGHSIVAIARRPVPTRTRRVKRRDVPSIVVDAPAAPLPSSMEPSEPTTLSRSAGLDDAETAADPAESRASDDDAREA